MIVGTLKGSSCEGGTFSTSQYTWTKALVYYEFAIKLHDYVAIVDHENDIIKLRNGLECRFSQGKCLDSEEGYITWDTSMKDKCEQSEYEIIYEGTVNKTWDGNEMKEHRSRFTVYSTISDNQLFIIKAKEKTNICSYQGYTTDHPRIFVLENKDFKSPFTRKITDKNYDMFTYYNSKISLVENYIGRKLNEVFNTIMNEMCKIDKAVMETKLIMARINPTEFVSSIIKNNGYTAIVAGEILHIIKCKAAFVTVRGTERCFQELPIFYNNETMFLTPVTRIIQKRGTEIECASMFPAKYYLGGRWYSMDGYLRETSKPKVLRSDIMIDWTYTSLPNLLESGVYSPESIEKMRNMIFEQGDRRAASAILPKVLSGQNPSYQGFKFESMLPERAIEGIIQGYWNKITSWSSWLGQITSTGLGMYLLIKVIKIAIYNLFSLRNILRCNINWNNENQIG